MNSCECEKIYKTGSFSDYDDFGNCERVAEEAIASGLLKSIPEPSWFTPPPSDLGGAGYFKCTKDKSVWEILIPERAQRGHWKKIK
jgi:hypothetical protein